jgi:hypothetical protein
VIENLVDAWLTEASERSYESPFAQLLMIEGNVLLQGPMHHAHEHGKDILAWSPTQELCVYQLKGGAGRLDLKGVEAAEPQLTAASISTVTHPSLPAAQPPARVILVTNQTATGPAQDRLRVMSDGLVQRGLAPLHLVEKAELISRFVDAEGRFFPSSPKGLSTFLSLFLADGRGPLPRNDIFRLLEEILPVTGPRPRATVTARAISSACLTLAFAIRNWVESENHAEIAIAWACLSAQILRVVERTKLGRVRWDASYRLALEGARRHARLLLVEALAAEDLAVPAPTEPLVYAARVIKVCGIASALAISERVEFGQNYEQRGKAGELILRERDCFRVVGEIQAPEFFLSILALSEAGEYRASSSLLLSWIAGLASSNRPDSTLALPDPYHSVEEVITDLLPPRGSLLSDEDFAGSAYTLHIGIRWAVRRLWRQSLASVWSNVTRINHHSFDPSHSIDYLVPKAPRGDWNSWFYPTPTSWADLVADADVLDQSGLPETLLQCPEIIPFYCLALPHRFNRTVADLLDSL